METPPPDYLDGPHGRIAYRAVEGSGPCIVWFGGFRSDMLGSKAEYLSDWARDHGRAYLRFDYSGHGVSDGVFEDGTIGAWTKDALTVVEQATEGPLIIVGSSMGAWVASHVAIKHPERIAAAVFIAPAPDFTDKLMWPSFSEEQRNTILSEGKLVSPSDYSDEPEVITLKLIEDGRNQSVMNGSIPINCPVRIIQGMKDEAVPWEHAVEFAQQMQSADVALTLTKEGDHRLSTEPDLTRLGKVLEALSA